MGGSQKNIGQGKDGAITNPVRRKPYRRNGLQRKCQQKIPVPKSEENDAITNSLLKYTKNQTIHKAARSPTHYLQRSKGRIYSQGGAITYPLYKKVAGDTYAKRREANFRASLSTKGEGFSLLTFTHLLIPAALPPITSLGGIRGPITIPRGTTTRRRTFDRATGLSRTGTNTGCTLVRRRWRLGDLFG